MRCSVEGCKRTIRPHMEIECRCKLFFCKIHRFRTEHNCTFDYKKENNLQISRQNEKITSKKIETI